MTLRSLVAPSLLALVGCAGAASTDGTTTQLGIHTIPAKGERTETAAPSWAEVQKRVSQLPGGSGVLSFYPAEGTYSIESQIIHQDECGADASGFPAIDHGILDVNKRTGLYKTAYIQDGEAFDTLGCELEGHFYRCASSITTIDFGLFGMDAVVTIENGDFGTWAGQSDSFLGLNPYTVSCAGADCGEEPAVSVFGLITQPMPCSGIDGQKFAFKP